MLDHDAPARDVNDSLQTGEASPLAQSQQVHERLKDIVSLLLRLPLVFFSREAFWGGVKIVWIPLKYLLLFSFAGCLFFLIPFLGSVFAVGYSASKSLYSGAILWVPLIGPAMVVSALILIVTLRFAAKIIKNADSVLLVTILVAVFGIVGYFAARSEYEKFQPESPDVASLSVSTNEQMVSLGKLSASGTALLNQLQATETDLSASKDRLRSTLSIFEQQRKAASEVASQLEQLDKRQRAIALRTQELERILDGKTPITVDDLRRSGRVGLFWGFLLGILASIFANLLTRQASKSKPEHDQEPKAG